MIALSKHIAFALLLALSIPATAETYTIGTGNQSGTYYPLGGMLAKLWSENIPDFDMRAEVTSASVENIVKVASGRELAGISMGNVMEQAIEGTKPFPRKMDVAVLFALYPNLVQFIVPANSDINSIEDLKGKRVSLGAPGSGTRISAINILSILGIDKNDMDSQALNYSATTRALANGQIDAGVIVGSLGVGAITELSLTRNVRILSFSAAELAKISTANPAYYTYSAPAGIYNDVGAFMVPAVWNVLLVNKNLDNKLAYEMTKVTFEHIDELRKAISVTQSTTVDNMDELAGVSLHPGAQKYFDEHKIQQ
ncbi:TAXI family TRAP transporter solute-binding subunit [Shewanella surugensis]|uniref:TAXI family TRAP transporter solute-binding subunit n=1 Tax=Shewanella surugensis TaxID=212020 RepID=A0ABT0L9E5_9GAMM|nr:TAXI family TRAP transporter solute-binding subunit [Shewanella surugensis]MCL1124336.1 TAXI family TRAP transporter solute-binding subunit [Shewanella surugensis]